MFNYKSPINNFSLFIIALTVVVLAVDDVDEPKRMLAIPVGNPLNPAIGSALVSSSFLTDFGVSFLVESAAPKPDVEVTGAFGGGGLGDSSELNAGSSLDLFLLIFELEGRDDLSSTNALSGS